MLEDQHNDEELIEEHEVEEEEESSASEPEEQEEESSEEEASEQQKLNSESEEEKPTPFHEHPRFKELVEQKNQFKDQYESLAQERQKDRDQLIKLQAQFEMMQKPAQQEDPVLAELREVNPDFAAHYEALSAKASKTDELAEKLEEFDTWRRDQEGARVRNEAQTSLEKLYTENSVPAELRGFYEAQIEREAQVNPKLQVSDLPKVFEKIHGSLTSYVKGQLAAEKKQYTSSKKAASKSPSSQPKGAPVSQGGEKIPEFKTLEERKAYIVEQAMKEIRGNGSI